MEEKKSGCWPTNEIQLAQVTQPSGKLGLGCRIVASQIKHIELIQRALDKIGVPSALQDAGAIDSVTKETPALYFDGENYEKVVQQIQLMKKGGPVITPLPHPLSDLLRLAISEQSSSSSKKAEDLDSADSKELETRIGQEKWGRLKPYQRLGVSFFAKHRGRGLLGDGMGLGKSAQAIVTTLLYRDKWPVLVVCPSSIRHKLRHEFVYWANIEEEQVVVIQTAEHLFQVFGPSSTTVMKEVKKKKKKRPVPYSQAETLPPEVKKSRRRRAQPSAPAIDEPVDEKKNKKKLEADVYVMSYEMLCRPGAYEAIAQHRFRVMVVDESHYIKHLTSRRTMCVLQLAQKSDHVLLLSGTPGVCPAELYPQLLALQPNLWPRWWIPPRHQVVTHDKMHDLNHKLECSFAARWCDPRPQRVAGGRFEYVFTGCARAEELSAVMRQFCVLQRTKEDVLPGLPLKRRERISFSIDEKDRVEIETTMNEMRAVKDSNKIKYRTLHSQLFNRLPQVKLPFVRSYLHKLFEPGGLLATQPQQPQRKALVFGHHKAMMSEIGAIINYHKVESITITGETPSKTRQQMVDRFQNDPACRVAVLSMTAAGVGLDLFAATLVVFAEILFGPEILLQAEDRCHRLGQTKPVDVIYLIASESIEESVWRLVCRKQVRAVRLLQDREGSFSADRNRHVDGVVAAADEKTDKKKKETKHPEMKQVSSQNELSEREVLELVHENLGTQPTLATIEAPPPLEADSCS